MTEMRIEKDSMGELEVPADALYAAQTQRAVNNFPISGLRMPRAFIRALGLIKAAAANSNMNLELMSQEMASAIIKASLEVAEAKHDAHFPVDVFQTGSGTSSNMNANEVIARLATDYGTTPVHANDHVNMGQSSNDVVPTAIQLSACLEIREQLLPAMDHLRKVLSRKAEETAHVVKTGRTHLMDAMPVSFAQELGTWAAQLHSNERRIHDALKRLSALPIGGTAVGTGINAHPGFASLVCQWLTEHCGSEFASADNLFEGISSQDMAVEVSGQLKTLAVSLMKISNDLRWMNSGPLAGIGEIELPALQPGSSIMPGKVNPVIPEAVAMVAAQVIGNDTTITVAGQSGNFQLNVMLPLVAHNLLQSIGLLANACHVLADKAITGFSIRQDNINEALDRNPILVTALNAVIGYENGAAIAKKAYAEKRPVIDVAREMTDLSEARLQALLDPAVLTKGGIQK